MAPSRFPVPPSLAPSHPPFLPSSHTHLFSCSRTSSPSTPLFVTPPPLPPWLHHGSPSTERLPRSRPPTLMARLLALMHFKRTAAATSQSARLSQISTIFILSFIQSSPGSDVLLIMSARLQLSDSSHHRLQPEYGSQLMIIRLIMHC